ncbi:fatty acid synthase alpha subunit Lsd1 [Coemansia sp. IMI 203386]|nr:fatty acid synthase alpha subunit Lsd1 [Coemansia sp. IMI 203386]
MQENFTSTIQAWVNMLLMSGSDTVKPIAGACATAAASVNATIKYIQSGKAQLMFVGGVEKFSEISSTEFANMGATCSTVIELDHGWEPSEMCRPCTSSRSRFVERLGASIVMLMSTRAAIKMGAPVYGVLVTSGTATDKQGRSVFAPGKGILTSARGLNNNAMLERRMSLGYRRQQLKRHMEALERLYKEEKADLQAEAAETNID